MTFKEFSHAIRKDARLMELLDRCDRSCGPMSDEDTQEMIDRAERIMNEEDEDMEDWTPAPDDPIWDESPVDLYGPWWE